MKHLNDYSRFENIGSDDEQPCAAATIVARLSDIRSRAPARAEALVGFELGRRAAVRCVRASGLTPRSGGRSHARARVAPGLVVARGCARRRCASAAAAREPSRPDLAQEEEEAGKATNNNVSQVEAEIARLRKEQADAMAALTAARDAANIAKRGSTSRAPSWRRRGTTAR